jgi:hypothetical protein
VLSLNSPASSCCPSVHERVRRCWERVHPLLRKVHHQVQRRVSTKKMSFVSKVVSSPLARRGAVKLLSNPRVRRGAVRLAKSPRVRRGAIKLAKNRRVQRMLLEQAARRIRR